MPSPKRLGRMLLERSPRSYCGAARLRRGRNRSVVSRKTDLVVESFPRCGNTFLVAALRVTAPDMRVASHLHHPAHLARAQQLGVQAAMILRPPLDACASLALYEAMPPSRSILHRWLGFHESAERFESLAIITFEQVTTDPVGTVLYLTELVGQLRRPPAHLSEAARLEVERMTLRRFGVIDPIRVSRPEAGREAQKREMRSGLEAVDAGLVEACEAVHGRLLVRARGFGA